MSQSLYKLKIKTLSNEWHDKDEVMLHACFQLLVDYIEDEEPETTNWELDGVREVWAELNRLYQWWKDRRNRMLPQVDVALEIDSPEAYKVRKIVAQWEDEDNNNLVSLIKLRGYLWT